MALRIDGGSASPAVLGKQVLAAAYAPSYSIGEIVLRRIGGVEVTGRGLNKIAVKIGSEMAQRRDAQVEAYFQQPLPRQHTLPKTPIQLACVSIDGGRMQTRDEGAGQGVHHPHWRETKNAVFLRMKSDSFADDPHPDLPRCFADREGMKTLLSGVAESGTPGDSDKGVVEETSAAVAEPSDAAWRPEPLFRTGISSLAESNAFGRLMAVEADLPAGRQAHADSTTPERRRLSATGCRIIGRFSNGTSPTSRRFSTSCMPWNASTRRPVASTRIPIVAGKITFAGRVPVGRATWRK
jgi:hypothetical protein